MNPGPGVAIEHVAETGSTNSDLLERARAAAASGAASFAPCLRVARRQLAGRGRHGRTWHGTPGASLTFSLAWPFAGADLSGLSLAVGTALADALADALEAPAAASRIGLKWPNDLWLLDEGNEGDAARPGRKLGGVLIETAPFGGGRVAVVGVGLNVLALTVDDAAAGVAWLAELQPDATPAAVLDRLVSPLVDALRRFERSGLAAFVGRFAARDLLRGRRVVAAGPDGTELDGVGSGISTDGDLLLRTAAGLRPVRSGEVRLRLAANDPAGPALAAAGSTC
jgi:BirA family biotin operon repressor/biotin-[acetyl-CoA-carboxylase] ligase